MKNFIKTVPLIAMLLVTAKASKAQGSVGIMIAGMGGLIPDRRNELVPLAMRALVSCTMASGLTGAIIGFLPIG